MDKTKKGVHSLRYMVKALADKYGVTPFELIDIIASHNGDAQAAMADLESRIKN